MVRWSVGLGLALLIVVGGWWVFENGQADRGADGAVIGEGMVGARELRVGDCVTELDLPGSEQVAQVDPSVHAVPCDQPHLYEVFARGVSGLGRYSQEAAAREAEEFCEAVWVQLGVGPRAGSGWALASLFPSPAALESNLRAITCLATPTSRRATVGSFLGELGT